LQWGRRVSPELDPPFWLCSRSQLLGAIKGWFVGQSLNFFPAPSMTAVIILARSSQNYPRVAPISQGVLESQTLGFHLPYTSLHLGSSKHYFYKIIHSHKTLLVILNSRRK
jgi:hypothetical protein